MGISDEHVPALVAVACLAPVLGAAAVLAGRRGWRTGRGQRGLAALLAMTAAIHLGLVPGHFAEDRTMAALFAADFAALALAAISALGRSSTAWRFAVAALLLANLGAYAGYVAAGMETVDTIGLASKAIELAALLLVVRSARASSARPWARSTRGQSLLSG